MRRGLFLLCLYSAAGYQAIEERLARHRNLGKAFFENPTTQKESVEEFRKALQLAPNSTRERLNFGLALLAAGQTVAGIAEVEKVQKQDASIPHTWFNLGVQYKKAGEYAKAQPQFAGFVKLVPGEPAGHYNLGTLHKLDNRNDLAIQAFETASSLDPNLAAPHFQLYNLYRQAGRRDDAAKRLQLFQKVKSDQANAAVPEDMEWSFYSEILEVIEPRVAETKPVESKFVPQPAVKGPGVVVMDSNGDGVPEAVPFSTIGPAIQAAAPADYNNDGLTDVAAITAKGPALFMNGKGRFVQKPLTAPAGKYSLAVWLDYDHDYDLDLLLLGENQALIRNEGMSGFADRSADFPFVRGTAISAAVFRSVADTKGLDLVVTFKDRGAVIYRDKLAGKFVAEPLDAIIPGDSVLQAIDADANGSIDLLTERVVVHNKMGAFTGRDRPAPGPGIFADFDNRGVLELHTPPKLPAGRYLAADVNGDAKTDLVVLGEGSSQVLVNRTATPHGAMRIGLNGVKNPKLGMWSEVEVKAGTKYQKRIYNGYPLVLGMQAVKIADAVRITWPNGLIQSEANQAVRAQAYKEAQRLSGSCPQVWTWNGQEFVYITDVLGVAPLGASAGDGTYFPVDSLEHIQIPHGAMQPRNGFYEIRLTEELSEVAYVDQVRLIAVDHAAGSSVFLNEKFQAPPYPPLRIYQVVTRQSPLSQSSGSRTIEIDFGRHAAVRNNAVMILTGWVDWADGSTFLARSQEKGNELVMPSLQVKDSSGQWRTVLEDMGMPAGKPKSIVIDLRGKFLSADRRVRIVTNVAVHWNEAFLAEGPPQLHPRAEATPADAQLRFRGFSRARIDPERRQPENFFYANPLPASMWNPTPGFYTRYGDVKELTVGVDDRMVIMGSGDELILKFDASWFPLLTPGMTRSFVLAVDGWAKDRDANTAHSQSVEPLPFHGMSAYPYQSSEKFPDMLEHREWRKKYQTRPALRLLRPLTD